MNWTSACVEWKVLSSETSVQEAGIMSSQKMHLALADYFEVWERIWVNQFTTLSLSQGELLPTVLSLQPERVCSAVTVSLSRLDLYIFFQWRVGSGDNVCSWFNVLTPGTFRTRLDTFCSRLSPELLFATFHDFYDLALMCTDCTARWVLMFVRMHSPNAPRIPRCLSGLQAHWLSQRRISIAEQAALRKGHPWRRFGSRTDAFDGPVIQTPGRAMSLFITYAFGLAK